MRSENNLSLLTIIAKLIGLVAVIAGIFGVSYQKGMIMKMGFGNLNGNYDIREVFNSAVFGFFDIFDRVNDSGLFELLVFNWMIVVIFTILGVFIPVIYNSFESIKRATYSLGKKAKNSFDKILKSYWISPIIGMFLGVILNLLSFVFSYLFLLAFAIFISPALMGYVLGSSKIESIKGESRCVQITDDQINHKNYIDQCPKTVIGGYKFHGEVLLENATGYFIHLDDRAFFYLKFRGSF